MQKTPRKPKLILADSRILPGSTRGRRGLVECGKNVKNTAIIVQITPGR